MQNHAKKETENGAIVVAVAFAVALAIVVAIEPFLFPVSH
jgi:hypothetical protein